MFLPVLVWTLAFVGIYEYFYLLNIKEGRPHAKRSHTSFQSPKSNMQIRDGYKCVGVEKYDPIPQYFTRSGMKSGVRQKLYACHGDTGQSVVTSFNPKVGEHFAPNK